MKSVDRLRDAVRDYVITHLGGQDASLVIDDTQAQKKGTKSVGAPAEIAFATKPGLAITMLEHARAADVPFSWVLADAGYGRDPQLRAWCHGRKVPYVFGVPVDLPIDGSPGKPRQPAVKRADDLLHYAKVRDQWERRSCGDGAKGERLRLDGLRRAGQRREPNRRGKDGQLHREIAYFLVHAPADTTVSEVIARAGGRWQIEEDNEINKQLVGLAQYQVRKWTPWHRHVTACMLATAFLSVQRAAIPEPDQTLEPEPDADPEQVPDQGKAPSIDESGTAG
ncbi:transposase [Streptomyces sp. NPDC006617]|uniref:IS701 family transposase n=1 Tax=Streptomyces sp. NPDC006617 TaxID=3155354 RepID=UPI0033AA792F